MCGLMLVSGAVDVSSFWEGMNNIKHRGPDAEGVFFYDNNYEKSICTDYFNSSEQHNECVALGHHRLKIVDLESSSQPMYFDELVMVYNGEIYNFREIRKKLQDLGYSFETEGDTEVVLKAFHKWGKGCEKLFNGMWSFVVFNPNNKTIYASRDRFGVKPLYYYKTSDVVVIASEIKAILPFIKDRLAVKEEVVKYLIYGAQESDKNTLFEGVKRLCPGECLFCNVVTNELNVDTHITPSETIEQRKENQVRYNTIEELNEIVQDAINLRAKIELPFVIALSGGVDSNIITSSAVSMGYEFSAVSATYGKESTQSENHLIDETVNRYNLEHCYVRVDNEDIVENLKAIIWYQDEPFDSLGIYAQNLVYKKIANLGIKVSLDGQGADEAFGGYPTTDPAVLKEISLISLIKKLMKRCEFLSVSSLKIYLLSISPYFFERLYFFKRAKILFKKKQSFVKSSKKNSFRFDSLQERSLSDVKEHLPVLLRYLDRNSMQYSIESRGPFLDYRVVNAGLAQKAEDVFVDGYRKYTLRSAFKGMVDDKILFNRVKNGFSVPQEKWMNSEVLYKQLKSYVSKSTIINQLEINKYDEISPECQWRVCCLAIWESEFGISGLA